MKKITLIVVITLSFNAISAEIERIFSGSRFDGIIRTQDNDFVVATGEDGQVIRFDQQGNSQVLASAGAYFLGVAQDSEGIIYASDASKNEIISINNAGQINILTTEVRGPANIEEAPDGSLYVGTLPGNGVFKVTKSGEVTQILTGLEAKEAVASTFDDEGNYYVSNSVTADIFRLTTEGDFSLFASLPITPTGFRLGHMVFKDGYIYATGFADNRIYRVTLDGSVSIAAGPGAEGGAGSFTFNGPAGITTGENPHELYITNYNSRTIDRVQLDVPEEKPQIIEQTNGLSGLWFDPALDGEGYNIIDSDSGLLIIYYGYDNSGERLWLISEIFSESLSFNESSELMLFQTINGTFIEPIAPSDDNLTAWGSIQLTFSDCNSGIFEMIGIDGKKTTMVQQLSKISGTTCE